MRETRTCQQVAQFHERLMMMLMMMMMMMKQTFSPEKNNINSMYWRLEQDLGDVSVFTFC